MVLLLKESECLLSKMEKEYFRTKRTTFDFSFYADFSNDAVEKLEMLGYIRKIHDIAGSIELIHPIVVPAHPVMRPTTQFGRNESGEHEAYSEKECNDRTRKNADKKKQNAENTIDKREKFIRDIAVAIIGSTAAGLIVLAVQEWPTIVSFLSELFQ